MCCDDAGYCVNLADPNATMLISRLPGGADDRMFLQWGVYTGSNFAEAFEGTNGLGTALAEQRPILVHRDEHFRERWGIFSCAVAPLFDHGGRLAGAVNITSCRDDLGRTAHQLALASHHGSHAPDRTFDLPPAFSQRLDRDGAGRGRQRSDCL